MRKLKLFVIGKQLTVLVWVGFLTVIIGSCKNNNEEILAPYGGGIRSLASFTLQDSTYNPKFTWVGGYAAALGVNRGGNAALDSTLIWLITTQGDNIQYPVKFGQLPQGAQDRTTSFGGIPITRLIEDQEYTFWLLKDDAWSQLSNQKGKMFRIDSLATSAIRLQGDTAFVRSTSYTQVTDTVNILVNIKDFESHGKLADITIEEIDSSNSPIVKFTITQGTDSLVAATGLVVGSGVYDVNNVVWEVLSEETVGGQTVYGKNNVIKSPFIVGQSFPQTHVFAAYPSAGLQRNKVYYLWIAGKDWDGTNRDVRTINYYAWATFKTW